MTTKSKSHEYQVQVKIDGLVSIPVIASSLETAIEKARETAADTVLPDYVEFLDGDFTVTGVFLDE